MRLIIYDGVRYLLNSSTEEAIGEFHRQLPAIKADIEGMRASQPLWQKSFHREDKWHIKEHFGITTVNVNSSISKGGKKKQEQERRTMRERYLLGIEYTNGEAGATIYGWIGPTGTGNGFSYIGRGIQVGVIQDGTFVGLHDLRWNNVADQVDLLSPWKRIVYSFPSGIVGERYNFNSQMQGRDDSYSTRSGPGTSVIEPLKEQVYSLGFNFDVKWSVVEYGNAVFPYETWGPSTDEWYHWWQVYTSQIEVNGVIVAGPFDYTVDYLYNWVNSNIRYETVTYTGETVYKYHRDALDVAARPNGISIDSERYFYLYSKITSNNAQSFNTYVPSNPSATKNTRSYSGTFTHEMKANCSGVEHDIAQKTMDWVGPLRFEITPPSPFIAKCVRIFAKNANEGSKENLVYTFSYWEPQYMDQETGLGDANLPPVCQYGMIYNNSVYVTTVGFESIGVANNDDPDFPYTEYNHDLNIVPELPDGYNSSILTRAYVETYTQIDNEEIE